MKTILLLAALVLGTLAVSAQSVGGGRSSSGKSFFSTEKADKGVTIGIRGGIGTGGMSTRFDTGKGENYSFKTGFGYNAGINLDIPIVKSAYIQTGLFFTCKSVKFEETCSDKNIEHQLSPMFIEIPLLASYRYDFNEKTQMQVNIGPYFAYGIAGKLKRDLGYNLFTETKHYEGFADPGGHPDYENVKLLNPFDAGISIGLGATFNKFFIGLRYEIGLKNICEPSGWNKNKAVHQTLDIDGLKDIKTRNFSFNIGYDF